MIPSRTGLRSMPDAFPSTVALPPSLCGHGYGTGSFAARSSSLLGLPRLRGVFVAQSSSLLGLHRYAGLHRLPNSILCRLYRYAEAIVTRAQSFRGPPSLRRLRRYTGLHRYVGHHRLLNSILCGLYCYAEAIVTRASNFARTRPLPAECDVARDSSTEEP